MAGNSLTPGLSYEFSFKAPGNKTHEFSIMPEVLATGYDGPVRMDLAAI
jgi:hypothetical protein